MLRGFLFFACHNPFSWNWKHHQYAQCTNNLCKFVLLVAKSIPMKISLIQTSLTWENPETNRGNFERLIQSIKEDTDIIILPEMFATGFTMQPAGVAESADGATVQWMKDMAKAKNCAVTGSLVIEENGKYYNRLFFVQPDGLVKTYDKRHLFSLAGEDKAYTSGTDRLIVEYRGWKICPLVCYDLRFPVFSRNTEDFDLMIYAANWPAPRVTAWDTLLKARAIENMCYVAGVNRMGDDPDNHYDSNGHEYPGHSQVFDELGASAIDVSSGEGVFTVTLDKEKMLETRKKFNFLADRDSFSLLR